MLQSLGVTSIRSPSFPSFLNNLEQDSLLGRSTGWRWLARKQQQQQPTTLSDNFVFFFFLSFWRSISLSLSLSFYFPRWLREVRCSQIEKVRRGSVIDMFRRVKKTTIGGVHRIDNAAHYYSICLLEWDSILIWGQWRLQMSFRSP